MGVGEHKVNGTALRSCGDTSPKPRLELLSGSACICEMGGLSWNNLGYKKASSSQRADSTTKHKYTSMCFRVQGRGFSPHALECAK